MLVKEHTYWNKNFVLNACDNLCASILSVFAARPKAQSKIGLTYVYGSNQNIASTY